MQRGLDIGRVGSSLSGPGGMADGGISDPSVSSDRGYGPAGSKCSLSGNQCIPASDGDGVGMCVEEGIPEIKETIETNRKKGTGALIETTEAQAEQRVQNRLSWNNYIVWLPCRAPDGSFFRQKD